MEQVIRIFCAWMNVLIRRIGNTPVDDYYYSHPVLTLVRVFASKLCSRRPDGKKRPILKQLSSNSYTKKCFCLMRWWLSKLFIPCVFKLTNCTTIQGNFTRFSKKVKKGPIYARSHVHTLRNGLRCKTKSISRIQPRFSRSCASVSRDRL